MGASKGLTTPLGEMLSDIIEPTSRMNETSDEAQSTEEVLRKIAEANKELEGGYVRDLALGSMDVVALYPSLDQEESARIVAEHIAESEVDFGGIDFDIAGVYLATVWSKERQKKEGIFRLLPRKRSNKGRRSTINSKELLGPIPRVNVDIRQNEFGRKLDEDKFLGEEDISNKWEIFKGHYTNRDKKLLLSKCVQSVIEVAFKNHVYRYHGDLYRQVKGAR